MNYVSVFTGLMNPVPAENLSAVAISHELAQIRWRIPRYTYIPEMYRVFYSESSADSSSSTEFVMGVNNLTAVDVYYTVILPGLLPNATYEFFVQSSVLGDDIIPLLNSNTATFTTRLQSKSTVHWYM